MSLLSTKTHEELKVVCHTIRILQEILYMGIIQYSSSEMPAGHRAGPYSMGAPLMMDII